MEYAIKVMNMKNSGDQGDCGRVFQEKGRVRQKRMKKPIWDRKIFNLGLPCAGKADIIEMGVYRKLWRAPIQHRGKGKKLCL